jgi:type I site-specific restriction-modification system R (restriction) subunit
VANLIRCRGPALGNHDTFANHSINRPLRTPCNRLMRVAVIADEAHSSQTREAAAKLKQVLWPGTGARLTDSDATINKAAKRALRRLCCRGMSGQGRGVRSDNNSSAFATAHVN